MSTEFSPLAKWPSMPLLWASLLIGLVCVGIHVGALGGQAVAALAVLVSLSIGAMRWAGRAQGWACMLAVGVMSLAMAMHALPGFHNPLLLDKVRTSADALPFSLYLNFDKGSVGLILLACFAPRFVSWQEARAAAKPMLQATLGTVLVVIGLAWLTGVVRFEPKLPAYTAMFLSVNLLFTCVAEEAFFRGLIQERLSRAWAHRPHAAFLPVLLSAGLFGLAHWGGGPVYAALATLAGLGYALVYAKVRRVEASILVHFAVNAVHFVGFTYPALAHGVMPST